MTPEEVQRIKLYKGEHYPDFWIGAKFSGGQQASALNKAIEEFFQSVNLINECINRHTAAVLANPPIFYFSDQVGTEKSGELGAIADQLVQRMTDNWAEQAIVNDDGILDYLEFLDPNPLAKAFMLACIIGRGYLRLYCPEEDKADPDPAKRVSLHAPQPDSISVERNNSGRIKRISYNFIDEDGSVKSEVQEIEPTSRKTVFWQEDKDKKEISGSKFDIDLNGRFTIFEIKRPSLISPSIIQSQKAINFTLTMLLRNVAYGGNRQMNVTNAQRPGRWEVDPVSGERTFIPDENASMIASPGAVNFIQGIPLFDEDGNLKSYSSPTVVNTDPVPPETFVKTFDLFSVAMYRSFSQGYVLASDLVLSGRSRESLKDDALPALKRDCSHVSIIFRSLIQTALLMVVDEVEEFKKLTAVVELKPGLSSPTGEQIAEARENLKEGLASLSRTMSAIGIEDTDAEIELIREEAIAGLYPHKLVVSNQGESSATVTEQEQEDLL